MFGRLVSYSGTEPLFEEPTKVDKKKFVSKKSNSFVVSSSVTLALSSVKKNVKKRVIVKKKE